MKILVCDKCGQKLTDPGDIDLVLKGMEAWQNSIRAKGEEPRGIFPCEHYRICGGEMIIIDMNEGKESLLTKVSKIIKRIA